MSKKKNKTNTRSVLTQYKADRNKRYDPTTDTVVPKLDRTEVLRFGEFKDINNELLSNIAMVKDRLDSIVEHEVVKTKIEEHPEKELFFGAYNTFVSDTGNFLDELEKIYESHVNLKGVVRDQEELDKYNAIYGLYSDINLAFADLTAPVTSTIALIATDILKDTKGNDDVKNLVSMFNEGNATLEEIEKHKAKKEEEKGEVDGRQ